MFASVPQAEVVYNPNRLLDELIERLQVKNDAALCRILDVSAPVISKIRHHRLPIGASLMIRMHEVTGLTIRDIRTLMGDRRSSYRLSDSQGKPKAVAAAVHSQAPAQEQRAA